MPANFKTNRTPLLSFEFALSQGNINTLTFQNPLKIISAQTIEEVIPSFQLVQEAVEEGYYAAGYVSYESAPAFDPAFQVNSKTTMPILWFAIFSTPQEQPIKSNGIYSLSEWTPLTSKEEYHSSIQTIKQFIENGVTYQTNYTIRLTSHFQGDDIAYFESLKRAQASNYSAYINTGEHSILSASPELFFHLNGDTLTTRPMKGTIKRGHSFASDKEKANWLFHSEKNRAENLMIVDLLRNDLGIIAVPGTVTVPELFTIEHYPTVHQMTSTVSAKIEPTKELIDIFKALFPCGSITGAPKISTMNLISELEPTPREVYCGAIGFITPDKEAVFNVPIRTVLIDHTSGTATYGVGGGVTWDSTTEDEYNEILAKAQLLEENRPVFQLLESLLIEDGKYFLLEEHLQRLRNSADYFRFEFSIKPIENALQKFAKEFNKGEMKVRLILDKLGDFTIEGQPISEIKGSVTGILAPKPIDRDNPFLYHKTTHRDVYTSFQKNKPTAVYDVLLWNQDREITEFTNGNVILEIDGQLWTPPIQSGLLSGTYREWLIKKGIINERALTIDDLDRCRKVWFINSVRKWIEIHLQS